ncbi:hypothetical protein [Saccharopolyspora pogona]|uniref:hypothetical protein n=1 Tax=Saccharopolyspora pogona TaxID=333966 RepID=UPI001689F7AA|nr:hypothetical protein [Saccharopolyspora pogona]
MSAADRAAHQGATVDIDGIRAWPDLLDGEGPLTAYDPAPTAAELETLQVLFARYLSSDLAEAIEDDTEALAELIEVTRRISGGEEVSVGMALDLADTALADRDDVIGADHPAEAFALHLAQCQHSTVG